MKKATSQDVAELAGVSQATVSLILNNSDKITFSNETKERVLAAAQKLNYRLPQRKKQREKKARFNPCLLFLILYKISADKFVQRNSVKVCKRYAKLNRY